MNKINLEEKFALFSDYYNPRIVEDLNENHIKLVKVNGDFVWHHHENEDELFLVVKGKLLMDFRDKTVELNPGEMIVVPKGVEHRPRATAEVHLVLIEPKTTLNTGNTENELTRKELSRI